MGEMPWPKVENRTNLPAAMVARDTLSVWGLLKQCIGKELTKITMPVVFNEPLSFLQRLTEYVEYSELLLLANQEADPVRRMELVAAFIISACSSNYERLGKPFNPLLGETYEHHREDLSIHWVSEQVSHHPPISAFYCESSDFVFYGAVNPKLKFWGKSLEVEPRGLVTLDLRKQNDSYTWQNPNCSVQNIVIGKPYVDHNGTVEIRSHGSNLRCVLEFKSEHRVVGTIMDSKKNKLSTLAGKWIEFVNVIRDAKPEKQNALFDSLKRLSISQGDDAVGDGESDISRGKCLWRVKQRPSNAQQFYSLTEFALQLNHIADDMKHVVAPTDSRLRPDIRQLESADIDAASEEKTRLEEKQRNARKERKKQKQEEWIPAWFQPGPHPITGEETWLFNQRYWQRNFANCSDIY